MAAMTTALTEFSDKDNSRVYVYTGHSAQKPKKILQRRKEPSGKQEMIEDVITTYVGTEDANGEILDARVTFTTTVRRPKTGIAQDVTDALAVHRDIIASDEFTSVINGSLYLK
jgi:hypothetical protein